MVIVRSFGCWVISVGLQNVVAFTNRGISNANVQHEHNNKNAKMSWRFTSDNARIKLKPLYPTFDK